MRSISILNLPAGQISLREAHFHSSLAAGEFHSTHTPSAFREYPPTSVSTAILPVSVR